MTHNLTDTEIHDLLATRHQIAIIWCVEDMQEIRPDLTEDQCWAVLTAAKRHHDANLGINWETLSCQAATLFPEHSAVAETGGQP